MSNNIIYDPKTGFYINTETGEVIEDYFEPVEGIRKYDEKVGLKIHSRQISPQVHDWGLHTYIGNPKQRFLNRRYRKLKALNRRMRVEKNQKLVRAIEILHEYARKLNLPKYVIEDAVLRLKKVKSIEDMYIIERRPHITSTHLLIAQALFASARSYGFPITLKELLEKLFNVKYKNGIMKIMMNYAERYPSLRVKPLSTERIIERVVNELGYNELLVPALKMYRVLKNDYRLTGKSRKSVASAIIYILGKLLGYNITQKQLAQTLKITEVAVRHSTIHIVRNHKIVVEVE